MSDPYILMCEEALRLLFAFLDEELEAEQHRAVEHHLRLCRSCYSRAEFERRLKEHLAALGQEPVGQGFEGRIRSLISQFDCT